MLKEGDTIKGQFWNEPVYGKKENFLYIIDQALYETLPNESKEKKLLYRFLSGRNKLIDEIKY